MNAYLAVATLLLALSSVGSAEKTVEAPTGWTPVKIGYVTFKGDIGSIPNRSATYGLDLGLPAIVTERMVGIQLGIGTESKNMVGLQVGGLGNKADNAYGLQVGLAGNVVERLAGIQISAIANNFDYNQLDRGALKSDISGFQIAPLMNFTVGIRGMQAGAFNFSRDTTGLQVGIMNRSSGTMRGVQIGLINWCGSLKGLQVGLINHIKNRKFLRTTPLINLSF